jgi:hypothetical protein
MTGYTAVNKGTEIGFVLVIIQLSLPTFDLSSTGHKQSALFVADNNFC